MMNLFFSQPSDVVECMLMNEHIQGIYNEKAERRITDIWGDGRYGSSRGSRMHAGIDFLVPAGSILYSPVEGEITKHGYCYRGDEYRYTQITDLKGNHVRLFYCLPQLPVGTNVNKHAPVAVMQELAIRYHPVYAPDKSIVKEGMPNHCHVEVVDGAHLLEYGKKSYFDPDEYPFA